MTPTIPILFVSGNPVAQGFVTSLSHPGKNLTGVAILTGDLTPKRIQLLKETATGMARLAILEDFTSTRGDARLPGNWRAIEAASRQLGIRLGPTLEIRKSEELDGAFRPCRQGGSRRRAGPGLSVLLLTRLADRNAGRQRSPPGDL